jgi:chemosensory pili system protein ChpA (sensor histidine kinase/response regulator)
MYTRVDKDLVIGFVAEARGYLPKVLEGINLFSQDPSQSERLDEAKRYLHIIKGASSMMGMPQLSQLASGLEDLLEEVLAGRAKLDRDAAQGLLAEIEQHLKNVLGDQPTPQAQPVEPRGAEMASDDLIETFALEAEDHLHKISVWLAALERDPQDKTLLHQIRRSAHSLKGAAGLVGFDQIARLAHRMEDLLDVAYDQKIELATDAINLLFASVCAIEDMIGPGLKEGILEDIYAGYDALLGGAADEAAAEEKPAAQQAQPEAPAPLSSIVRVPIERLDHLVRLSGELVVTHNSLEAIFSELQSRIRELQTSSERLRSASSRLGLEHQTSSALASSLRAHEFDELELDRYTEFHLLSRDLGETSDDLQMILGELGALLGELGGLLKRQGRLHRELQSRLARVRMVPLASLSRRLYRTVRTVSEQQGKLVDLVLRGEDTQLDKAAIEEMADPLLHIMRNAVDHGIEWPELRRALGKPERGTITMSARHEGAHIVIQISDDGAGIDTKAVRQAAIERGYDVSAMSEEELLELLFLPGLSTAKEVSQVSGRGVGLDVVRAAVSKLRGSVRISSRRGLGTTCTIRLPITLSMIRAMIVKAGPEVFAIPAEQIAQVLRVDQLQSNNGNDTLRVGSAEYAAVHLAALLNLEHPHDDERRKSALIAELGQSKAAIIVDQVLGVQEVVVKNLGKPLGRMRAIMGATIAADGSAILILNLAELRSRGAARRAAAAEPLKARPLAVMIVDDSPSVRRVVSKMIERAGWKPLPAKDGLDALEIISGLASPPDLILLDIEMPRMDGYEFLSSLRSQQAHIPVIVLTSRASEKHRKKAFDLGATEYVIKPYQEESLLALIRKVAGRA